MDCILLLSSVLFSVTESDGWMFKVPLLMCIVDDVVLPCIGGRGAGEFKKRDLN